MKKLLLSVSTSALIMSLNAPLSAAMENPDEEKPTATKTLSVDGPVIESSQLNDPSAQAWFNLFPEDCHDVVGYSLPALLKLNATEESNCLQALTIFSEDERLVVLVSFVTLFRGMTNPVKSENDGLLSLLKDFHSVLRGFHKTVSNGHHVLYIPLMDEVEDEIARCKIIKFISRIPEKDREKSSPIIVNFFKDLAGADDTTYGEIVDCIFEMSLSQVINVMESVTPLLKYTIDKNEVPFILRALYNVSCEECKDIIDCAIPLFKIIHGKDMQYPILWDLQSVSGMLRARLVEMIIPFAGKLEWFKCANTITCFKKILIGEKTASPIGFLKNFIPDMTESLFKESIANQWHVALASCDKDKIKRVSDFILEHFRKFGFNESDPIIQEAVKVRIEDTIEYMHKFYPEKDKNEAYEVIRSMLSEQREGGDPTITLLFSGIKALGTRHDILQVLLKLPPEERTNFVKNVILFLKGLLAGVYNEKVIKDVKDIMDVLLWLPFEERTPFVDAFFPLFEDIKEASEREAILRALTWVPSEERGRFAKFAFPVIKDITDGLMRADVLKALALTAENRRVLAAPSILKFFQNISDRKIRITILNALQNISGEDIEKCINIFSETKDGNPNFFEIVAIGKTPEKCLHFLLSLGFNLKASVTKKWHVDLSSSDKRTATCVSKYILIHFEKFGFNSLEPIVQEAAKVGMASELPESMRKIINEALDLIPIQDHSLVLPNILSIFRGNLRDWILPDILKALEETPQEERTNLIQVATPYLKNIEKLERWPYVLRSLGLIPQNGREKVAATIVDIIRCSSEYIHKYLINVLNKIPVEDRVHIIELAMPLFNVMLCNMHNYPHILDLLIVIPVEEQLKAVKMLLNLEQNDREFFETIAYLDDVHLKCLAFLMANDSDLKASILNHWHEILSSPDKQRARDIGHLIINNTELFGLSELDDIVQEAIVVGILYETSDDPLNPYNFFEKLKEERAKPITIDLDKLPRETFDGMTLCLNPTNMKALPQMVVTFKDLPKYSKDYLSKMQKQIEARLKDHANTFEFTWDKYITLHSGAMGSNYLTNLLSIQGKPNDIVHATAYKFIAFIAHLETLDNTVVCNVFSEQENAFLLMLSGIQHCPRGKNGGIEDCYARLPKSAQYSVQNTLKGQEFLEWVIRSKIEEMFSGTNNFFDELTGKIPNEELNQAIHQALLVKNMIGHEVGLNHTLSFDRHTQVLNVHLVSLTKQRMFDLYYKHFVSSKLVHAVVDGVNYELRQPKNTLYKNLWECFGNEPWFKDAWDIDTDSGLISLKEVGAIQFLLKIGALNEMVKEVK